MGNTFIPIQIVCTPYTQSAIVLNCVQFAVSLFVLPVPLTTLVVLGWKCYREKRLLDALPLLVTQFLSALTWSCLAAYEVGFFISQINGTRKDKCKGVSLHDFIVSSFLQGFNLLEPLNVFLYTWRLLRQLEKEEKN